MEIYEKRQIAKMARLYRALRKLKQKELGELCGCTQRTISYLEREDFRMSESTLNQIGDFLKSDILVFSAIEEIVKSGSIGEFMGGLA